MAFLKKIIHNSKEIFPFLGTSILILGGVSQLLFIGITDLALLRFFSTSQMLIDGLLLSAAFLSLIFFYLLIFSPAKDREQGAFANTLVALFVLFFYRFEFELQPFSQLDIHWNLVGFAFILIAGSLKYKSFLFAVPVEKHYEHPRWLKILFWPVALITGLIFISSFFAVLYQSFHPFFNPQSISNYTNVETYMEKEGFSTTDYDVRYFNDKYIFIEFEKPEKAIKVFPIEIFFEN